MDIFFKDKYDKVDELTKVYKRDVIVSYMEKLMSENTPFDVSILDVDNFKYVNDGYGHLVGDKALIEIAKRIEELLGDEGVVGRYGGDEFIMVAPNKVEYDEVWQLWHSMLQCSTNLPTKEINDLNMTVTIGSSRYPLDSTNIDELFELADKALYRGKMKGRNCFIIYLKEKHANINLKTERDKMVSSMYIHSMIYNKISQDDIKSGLMNSLNYIGNYFMIDHLCISSKGKLYFDYYHPICKKRDFKALSDDLMNGSTNSSTGIFYRNLIDDSMNQDLAVPLLNQKVYSSFWVEIKAHGKSFGYVRADICENPRGRIWQNLDMDVLLNLAQVIGLELYYRNLEIGKIK
ncbi:MAG: GGDEF domain-containing protein [Acholeplasmatales bacterium]|nr:GGDEF domain-containing protein [Acholeplasmatales bacterium]